MPSRRQVLAGLGGVVSTALAGCATGGVNEASAENVTERWRADVGAVSAPAVTTKETVFATTVTDVVALDRETGERRWSVSPENDTFDYTDPPALGSDTLYHTDGDSHVRAFDVEDGSERWSFEVDYESHVSPELGHDGSHLFVAAGERVFRLNAQTGEEKWSRRLFGHLRGLTLSRHSTELYAATEPGEVYALGADSGEGYWHYSLPDYTQCPPVVEEETVYIGCWDGNVYALDDRGRTKWATHVGGFGAEGIDTDADSVYANSGGGTTYALARESGERRWEVDHGDTLPTGRSSPPVATGATVYAGGDALYALDAEGGLGVGNVRFGVTRYTKSLGDGVGHLGLDRFDDRLYAGVRRDGTEATDELVALEGI